LSQVKNTNLICVNVQRSFDSNIHFMQALSTDDLPIFLMTPLSVERAAATLPFVRLFEPDLTAQRWRDFVRSLGRSKSGGLMALQDRRGYVHGLFSWRPACSISHGRALRIADVVLAQLPGQATLRAFLDGVKDLAAQSDCDTVLIELGERARHVRADIETLDGAGFRQQAASFCCVLRHARAV
jgi:hypothetical protein